MPLVVPGVMTNNSGDKTEEWMNKLVGKRLADEPSNETVCQSRVPILSISPANAYCRPFARPICHSRPASSSLARW